MERGGGTGGQVCAYRLPGGRGPGGAEGYQAELRDKGGKTWAGSNRVPCH